MQGILLQPEGVQRDTQAKRSLHFIHTHTHTPAPEARRPPSLASICRTQLFCTRLWLLSVHELNMASVSVLSPRTFTVPWGRSGGPCRRQRPSRAAPQAEGGQGRGWCGKVGPGLPLALVFKVQPSVEVPLGTQQVRSEGVLGRAFSRGSGPSHFQPPVLAHPTFPCLRLAFTLAFR